MYDTFGTRVQNLVGTAVTDSGALTEWLTEEAMNAIDMMPPEMLISASSTHRLTIGEQINDSSIDVAGAGSVAIDVTTIPTDAITAGANAELKAGDIIAIKNTSNEILSERMKIVSVDTNEIEVIRGFNGTTPAVMATNMNIMVVLENSFNTRKFKLLEVNRDGYAARLIPSGFSAQAYDSESIHYGSKRNPAYFIRSGNIYFRPLITASEHGEIVGLTYPVVQHNMKSATDLPVQAEDFIVIGAARKYLIRNMYEEFSNLPTDLTKPTVAGATEELTGTISSGSTLTDFSDWFNIAGDLIQNEEDVELASAHLQKIGTYIQTHQEELSAKNAEFSSALQKANTSYTWFLQEFDKLTQMYNEKAQILRGA